MNTKIYSLATDALWAPSALDLPKIEQALSYLSDYKIDYGDFYFQQSESETWSLENSKVKNASFSIDRGVGVRAVIGEKTGFAYADEISFDSIINATKTAREISGQGSSLPIKLIQKNLDTSLLYQHHNPLASLTTEDKIALLQNIDQTIRQNHADVTQVFANLSGRYETVLVVATDGTLAADIRPLVRLNVTVMVEKDNQLEQGNAGLGGRYLLSEFLGDAPIQLAEEAYRQARVNLEAKPAPAGNMDVVLGSGWPGVLLHEAVGHGLEADFNRKKTSVFSGRMGESVASSLCTIVDNGALESRRGSLQIDDEGTPTSETILIENGILKNYLHDKLSARLMGVKPTGNGRRESYAYLPMPRMTNTYMLAGKSSQAEMIENVKEGIFAVNFAGGQVDITSGKFVFSTSEAYRIQNGKITYPIKDATLVGNGPDVMQRITMVGDDLALDKGVGVCGKEGQSVPVGVGQPSLLIRDLVVGGTAHE